jgi:hypothetical protein
VTNSRRQSGSFFAIVMRVFGNLVVRFDVLFNLIVFSLDYG